LNERGCLQASGNAESRLQKTLGHEDLHQGTNFIRAEQLLGSVQAPKINFGFSRAHDASPPRSIPSARRCR
jgi:hypothetical protein